MSGKKSKLFPFIIKDLKFLAEIGPNRKPCFKNETTVAAKSILTSLSRRYWYQEDRKYGIEHVRTLLKQINFYLTSENNLPELISIAGYLEQACIGLSNLVDTYKDDKETSSGYNECKDEIKTIIQLYLDKIQLYRTPVNSDSNSSHDNIQGYPMLSVVTNNNNNNNNNNISDDNNENQEEEILTFRSDQVKQDFADIECLHTSYCQNMFENLRPSYEQRKKMYPFFG